MVREVYRFGGLFVALTLLALGSAQAAHAADGLAERYRMQRYYECAYGTSLYGPNGYEKRMNWWRTGTCHKDEPGAWYDAWGYCPHPYGYGLGPYGYCHGPGCYGHGPDGYDHGPNGSCNGPGEHDRWQEGLWRRYGCANSHTGHDEMCQPCACEEPESRHEQHCERCCFCRFFAPGSLPPCKCGDICLYRAIFLMSPWYSNPRDGIVYPAYGSKSPTCVPQND